jgi:predicted nuclease of predicted toxin-antitoxin system
VKLLLDANLSPYLVGDLAEIFPGSLHVRDVGLASASDTRIWEFAAADGYIILSKDSDFHQRSFVHGAPPKVVWVRIGNCTTTELLDFVRSRADAIRSFAGDPEAAFLVLSR